MEKDLYAIELERAIYNWYLAGENGDPCHIFEILKDGLDNNIQAICPISTPEDVLSNIENIEDIKVGDTFTAKEDIHFSLEHIGTNEEGEYLIPVFTSEEEFHKGEIRSTIVMDLSNVTKAIYSWDKCQGIVVNPWDKRLILNKDHLQQLILNREAKAHISAIRESVVHMHVGAIVNAANKSLLGGGGVDGAIHKAAGPKLLEECRKLNGCNVGEAKSTKAYNIKNADWIIHTVGPIYSGSIKDEMALSECYYNSLEEAYKKGCKSIAFPCISTGVYGYPLEEAVPIAVTSVVKWLSEHTGYVINIYFCCFTDEEYAVFTDFFNSGNE